MANEVMIAIPGRLHSVATEGITSGANEIFDDRRGAFQSDLNGGILEEKAYSSGSDNGMGRVVLKKNIVSNVNTLTQAMINTANTIYVIQYDFVLGEDITVPANCVLEFDGGSISGAYTITGNKTGIKAGLVKIFDTNIILGGSWNISESYPEWFGAIGDGNAHVENSVDINSLAINKALKIGPVFISSKTYNISNDIILDEGNILYGSGFSSIISCTGCGLKDTKNGRRAYITVRNLKFIGDYNSTWLDIYNESADAITRIHISDVYVKTFLVGIYSKYTWCNLFDNLTFQSVKKSLDLGAQTNSCQFNSCTFVGDDDYQSEIVNCEQINFYNCNFDNKFRVSIRNSEVNIDGGYFENILGNIFAIVGPTGAEYPSSVLNISNSHHDSPLSINNVAPFGSIIKLDNTRGNLNLLSDPAAKSLIHMRYRQEGTIYTYLSARDPRTFNSSNNIIQAAYGDNIGLRKNAASGTNQKLTFSLDSQIPANTFFYVVVKAYGATKNSYITFKDNSDNSRSILLKKNNISDEFIFGGVLSFNATSYEITDAGLENDFKLAYLIISTSPNMDSKINAAINGNVLVKGQPSYTPTGNIPLLAYDYINGVEYKYVNNAWATL